MKYKYFELYFLCSLFLEIPLLYAQENSDCPHKSTQVREILPKTESVDFNQPEINFESIKDSLKKFQSSLLKHQEVNLSPWKLHLGMGYHQVMEILPEESLEVILVHFPESEMFYHLTHGQETYDVRLGMMFKEDDLLERIMIKKEVPSSKIDKTQPALAEKPQTVSPKTQPVCFQPWGIHLGMTLLEVEEILPLEISHNPSSNEYVYHLKHGMHTYKLSLTMQKKDNEERVEQMQLEKDF